jgi:hypothetical protein
MVKLLVALLTVPPALVLGFILERRRKRLGGPGLPYLWGYFVGTCTAGVGVVGVLVNVAASLASTPADGGPTVAQLLMQLLLSVGFLACGILTARRNRWAFLTLAVLNPPMWVVNGWYLKRRWSELKGEAGGSGGTPASARAPTEAWRSTADAVSRMNQNDYRTS